MVVILYKKSDKYLEIFSVDWRWQTSIINVIIPHFALAWGSI